VQELRPPDAGECCQFYEWFLDMTCKNVSILDKTFFADKSWFHLNGYLTGSTAAGQVNRCLIWHMAKKKFETPIFLIHCRWCCLQRSWVRVCGFVISG
jgi:hypothetical protein